MAAAFIFETTPKMICAAGASGQIAAQMQFMGCKRIALVSDRNIIDQGLAEPALKNFRCNGQSVLILDQVEEDPPQSIILSMAEQAKAEKIDGVVGLGGGSSLDSAKLVALLTNENAQSLDSCYGVGQVKSRRLPLLLVPTTAGTGSEVTPIAIVTTGKKEKKGIVNPVLLPDIALLDAQLTLDLPPHITSATGIDAMVHAIEAYTSIHKKNPLSDMLAIQALQNLSGSILQACENGHNLEAREKMLLGAMLAGMAFANAPVAAVHALAYPIGGQFHVPHGLSNALILPEVLKFNGETQWARERYAELAPHIFPELRDVAENLIAEKMAEAFQILGRKLEMKQELREVGITHNHLPALAEDAMLQTRLLINNPREISYDDALKIYKRCL